MAIDCDAFTARMRLIERQKETVRLTVIGAFAVTSLIITIAVIKHQDSPYFSQLYPLIPHLYLIPIILLALWYPRRGMQVTLLLITAILILIAISWCFGALIDPVISLLNAGMDIAVFVVLALYAKDRTLVESVIRGFFERAARGEDDDSPDGIPQRARRQFEGAFEEVVLALQSPDDDVREEAVRALGELREPRAIEPLIRALVDDNRFVRREAAKSLGKIGDPRVIHPLIEALKDDDRYGREGAAEGLAELGDVAVLPLIRALEHPDWHVRMGAVIALRINGDRRAVMPISRSAGDENRFVRREAIKSLGRIGDEQVIPTLVHALTDEDRSVRMRAVGALAKFETGLSIESLAEATRDEDSGVRLKAMHALEAMKDPRAKKALILAMKNGTNGSHQS